MSGKFVIEGPEDFEKEIEFDKFMNEILGTETDKKRIEKSTGEGEFGRKVSNKYRETPGNSTRYGRKK